MNVVYTRKTHHLCLNRMPTSLQNAVKHSQIHHQAQKTTTIPSMALHSPHQRQRNYQNCLPKLSLLFRKYLHGTAKLHKTSPGCSLRQSTVRKLVAAWTLHTPKNDKKTSVSQQHIQVGHSILDCTKKIANTRMMAWIQEGYFVQTKRSSVRMTRRTKMAPLSMASSREATICVDPHPVMHFSHVRGNICLTLGYNQSFSGTIETASRQMGQRRGIDCTTGTGLLLGVYLHFCYYTTIGVKI